MAEKEVNPFSVLYNVGSHKKQMNITEKKENIIINGKVIKSKQYKFENIEKPKKGDVLLLTYKTINGEPIVTDEELANIYNCVKEIFNGDVITLPDYINIDLVDKKFLEDAIKAIQKILDRI